VDGAPWFLQEVGIELLTAGSSPTPCCFEDYRAWPSFGHLSGSHRAILSDSEIKRKAVHKRSQSTFASAYRNDLVGVGYYNLRILLKATSPGNPRDTGARPQYKER
jgi:hypothetical protein